MSKLYSKRVMHWFNYYLHCSIECWIEDYNDFYSLTSGRQEALAALIALADD